MTWGYASLFLEDTKGEYNRELRNDYFKSETTKSRNKLLKLGKISNESRWAIPENPFNTGVYFISYNKGNLPNEEILQNDLIEILNLYQDLIQLEPPNTSNKLIKELFNEYNETFLNTQMGKDHLLAYESYCKNVHKNFNTIMNDPEIVNNTSDPIINHLLPI